MIFPGLSTVRRTNNRNPDAGLTAVFTAVLVVIAVGTQQANGFVIGVHDVSHGGKSGQMLDMAKLMPLKEYKEDHVERGVAQLEDGHDRSMKLIVKRGAYYDKNTKLCVCDTSRSYPVIPSLSEEQRSGYCVQICGAPLEGVQSNAPTSSSAPIASAPTETSTSTSTSSSPTPNPQTPVAPVPPTAPTAPSPPTAPTAPTAPTGPTGPNTDTGNVNTTKDSQGSINPNIDNGNNSRDDNTGLKIGVGVAVGVFMSALIGLFLYLFLRRRTQRRREEDGITFGCVGDQADIHPALRTEKYIYSAPVNDSKHSMHSKHSRMHSRNTPPSPRSMPPAYSAPPGGVIPSSTNTSSTSLDTNPPILPLGAPSRVLDLNGGNRPFVPGNLNNNTCRNVSPPPQAPGPSSAVQPPSITFFLHPVKNDTDLEEEEKKWLDEEQRRIREKKEAVEELSKLRAEEDKIREKIRERMKNGR